MGPLENPKQWMRVRVSRRVLVTAVALAAVFLLPREGQVRTWHIKADSTGEVPTIRVALDSAASGDTILAAPGTYVLAACRHILKAVVLTSEAGPTETRIVPGSPPEYMPDCAFYISLVTTGRTEISGFWFDGRYYDGTGDAGIIGIDRCDSVFINNNVFSDYDGIQTAIHMGSDQSSHVNIENNTFVGGEYAIVNKSGWTPGSNVGYNIVWSRAVGMANFITFCNCVLDISDVPPLGNLEADPQFCGTVESRNLFLQADSPCAPGNANLPSWCDSLRLIGALPVGCGTTPVKTTSWGTIKNIFK